jgi:predicted nucleic acid-binding protein
MTPPEHVLCISRITVGEIEAAHRGMTQTTNQARRDEYAKFVNDNFFIVEVTEHTSAYYGEIMGDIWIKYPPSSKKTDTERHLLELGVDINDVWTVAVAWDHGLTFLTSDEMTCIKKVTEGKVGFDCWR